MAGMQSFEGLEYDDSPWTRKELDAAASAVGKQAGWKEMGEYDDIPEQQ